MADFQRRLQRTKADVRIKVGRKMIFACQIIPQPASHKRGGIAVDHIVGRHDVQPLRFRLRPSGDFQLQPRAAMNRSAARCRGLPAAPAAFCASAHPTGATSPQRAKSRRENESYFAALHRLQQHGEIQARRDPAARLCPSHRWHKNRTARRYAPFEAPPRRAAVSQAASRRSQISPADFRRIGRNLPLRFFHQRDNFLRALSQQHAVLRQRYLALAANQQRLSQLPFQIHQLLATATAAR